MKTFALALIAVLSQSVKLTVLDAGLGEEIFDMDASDGYCGEGAYLGSDGQCVYPEYHGDLA